LAELRQNGEALIAFDNVDLSLGGKPILAGIDVSIRKGELWVLDEAEAYFRPV